MTNKKLLMAVSLSALLLGGCFNSETGASQRAANGETETHAPVKHEAKAEAPKAEEAAPAAEEKAEAPKAEEAAPAAEEKAEAPKAEEAAPVAEEKAEAPKAEEAAAAPAAEVNLGACNGCHGANFEKKAMNVSKIVKDLSKADIVTALKGYKDGSYGGAMKGLMKGQVASLDDAAIEAIAAKIGK